MPDPIAFSLRTDRTPAVHSICLDEALAVRLRGRAVGAGPAILVVSDVAILDKMAAGVFDANDVQVLAHGDWSHALLLVIPQVATPQCVEQQPDHEFLKRVAQQTPELVELAQQLIGAVRAAGVEGGLHLEGHKWVNRPLNTFTVTIQPRARNFQFTLYGGPDRFGVTNFIKSDQNGYSRGWVRSGADIPKFVELAKIAYDRKPR